MVSTFLTYCGKLFHKQHPEYAKDFLPNPLTFGIMNLKESFMERSVVSEEGSVYDLNLVGYLWIELTGINISRRYIGDVLELILNT